MQQPHVVCYLELSYIALPIVDVVKKKAYWVHNQVHGINITKIPGQHTLTWLLSMFSAFIYTTQPKKFITNKHICRLNSIHW